MSKGRKCFKCALYFVKMLNWTSRRRKDNYDLYDFVRWRYIYTARISKPKPSISGCIDCILLPAGSPRVDYPFKR